MFEDWVDEKFDVGEAALRVRYAGEGPAARSKIPKSVRPLFTIGWLGSCLAAGLVLAGCSAVDDRVPAPAGSPPNSSRSAVAVSPSADGADVSCERGIGGTAPNSESYRLVLDAVALPTGVLEPHESGEPGWLFAKQGLVVRTGKAVKISVAAEGVADARIGWGDPDLNGTSISVPACRGSASGWLAFVGGYTVRKSGCVPLIVRVDEMEERIAVSVGAPC